MNRPRFLIIVLLLIAAGVSAQTRADPRTPAATRKSFSGATHRNVEYGEAASRKLLLDAHVPNGRGPFPVLLIVHGGGWGSGDKETDIVPVLGPAVTNFTWFTINYRLAPKNRWPACYEDVLTAIRWVKQHAPAYKGDPNRIALIGYSAGGHLVCLAATQAGPDTRVQAVVGFAPPTDIVADAERRGSMDKWLAMKNLLGLNTLDAKTKRIMREISPLEHVHPGLPPFLLVQGSADTTVPYKLTLKFEAKLKQNGVPCEFITIPGAQHRIRDWNKYRPGWAVQVAAWLNQHLTSAKARHAVLTQPGLLKSEFIFNRAPFPSCHASTLAETAKGLVAAWFGGTREGNPDVGIWVSRHIHDAWTPPVEVATGAGFATNRFPCWNPVLFQPRSGPLLLFYKVGPHPSSWWGMMMSSRDGGKTWSEPHRLPKGILGPIKDKPVQLPNGDILCPSSTEDHGWQVHFERTRDLGQTWQATPPVNDGKEISAIQPTILFHADGRLQALGRTRQERIFQVWSKDEGRTWGKMTLLDLPNPNSGIDAVTLRDGRQLLVYNHNTRYGSNNKGRSPLNVAASPDGEKWFAALVLEDDPNAPNGFSYPAVIQTRDGLVRITYTWERKRIKYVVIDPGKLQLRPIVNGVWPK